ncbi:MAG: hemerythrin domain-containing protein [Neisseria sp.]|nr:hemerythrin domain-containing protein [Neisseria sp.]
MKRHPQLIPLSREHHHTLSLCARILREPAQNHAAEIDEHYIELAAHFEHEETLFAPYWQPLNRDDLRERFEREHAQLRAMYRRARYDDPEWNTAFATLLRDHARFEERELFPAIEALLPPPEAA